MIETALFAIAGLAALFGLWAAVGLWAVSLRNSKGLYHWSRPIQVLICLADNIPLSKVGQWRCQEEFSAALFARMDEMEERDRAASG
jgi:hypothetical protein